MSVEIAGLAATLAGAAVPAPLKSTETRKAQKHVILIRRLTRDSFLKGGPLWLRVCV
jgi:hypothetical protein